MYIYLDIHKHTGLSTTQTCLNCHYKFISANNIIELLVSSDDFTHLIWGWKTAYMDYCLSIYICVCVCVCEKYVYTRVSEWVSGREPETEKERIYSARSHIFQLKYIQQKNKLINGYELMFLIDWLRTFYVSWKYFANDFVIELHRK